MEEIHIDIETYSEADLARCGAYRYAEDPSFEVLLLAYSADGAPVRVVDLARGEPLPGEVAAAILDASVTKWAHNAAFERVCLTRLLHDMGVVPDGVFLDPGGWRCSMVWAATLGLPLSLADVGGALGIERQKLEGGKDLIRYFCRPCRPTAANGGRTRNLPEHAPDRWEAFVAYNARDVEAEMDVAHRLSRLPPPEATWADWAVDQRINDRGVLVDRALVASAIQMDALARERAADEVRRITGVENPNSVRQLTRWLEGRGTEVPSLARRDVEAIAGGAGTPPDVRRVCELRLMLSKSSVRKYQAMEAAACADGRVRGMFQFNGAARTGRWAGRLVQLQNLPQNHLPDLAEARSLVAAGDIESVEMLYGDVPGTLSQLVRTAFVPPEGSRLIVCDYSAIEARVVAWLAGERWRLETFRAGGDIYCASASQMFGVPVEKHGANAHLRQKGKIAELALGYGGSVGALTAMGALDMGLSEDELPGLVEAWRLASPAIVRLWRDFDSAALSAVAGRPCEAHGVRFRREAGMLLVTLPSGRDLAYARPRVGTNRFGGESVTYEGCGTNRKWQRLETYGAKLVENVVQGTARDLLAHAMALMGGLRVVMHVHDEVVVEAGPEVSVADVAALMENAPPWAAGLPLRADGYECGFYMKD